MIGLSHAADRPRVQVCDFRLSLHKHTLFRLADLGPNGPKLTVSIFRYVGYVMKASGPNPMPPIATLVVFERAALGEGALLTAHILCGNI